METNQFFSLKRFYLLLRNDLLINYKTYLFTLIGACIVGYLVFFTSMPKHEIGRDFGKNEYFTSLIFYLLGLGVFVGLSFPEMNNKIKASKYLLIPSSIFEKFLAQFVLRIIGGFILITLLFWSDAYLARWTILSIYKFIEPSNIKLPQFSFFYQGSDTYLKVALTFCIFSLATYLFSIRLFFKKNALVKTLISFGLLAYLIVCFHVILSHIFYPETVGFDVNLKNYDLPFLHINNVEFWMSSIMILSGFFLLFLGYFKLKEKQV